MGILDEKRYADNMTREEIAHALKHGHPLVADYLVADAGKQMQENDALVRILEQQAGVSRESITDKLAAYLDKPLKYATSPSEQVDTLGRIDKMPQGRLAGAGDPMPGPQGAGGPMPGPRVPGGAGGAMPGMQRGPQGAGALMRRGGVVGFQNGGSPDELEWTGILADVPRGSYTKGTRHLGNEFLDLLRLLGRGGANVYGQGLRGKLGLARIASAFGKRYGEDEHGPYRNPEGELLMEGLFQNDNRWDPKRRGYSGMKRLVDPERRVPGYQNAGLVESGADFGERGLRDSYRDFSSSWQDPLLERFGIDVDALNTPEERDRRARIEEDMLTGVVPPWIGPKAVWGLGKSILGKGQPALDLGIRTLGGARSLYGRGRGALDVGAGKVAQQIAKWGGRPGRAIVRGITGKRHVGAQFVDPRSGRYVSRLAVGRHGVNRLAGTGASVWGAGYLADLLASGDGDDLGLGLGDGEVGGERRFPGDPGAGRSLSQDIFDQIETYRTAAGIPTEAEKNQNKLDADRAKELGDYRAGIAALRPTAQQYADSARGVGFGALSKVLARTGDPRKRQDFAQIGEDVRGERDRRLLEELGFEDKLAGIDTSIYGVESGSLGRQALRSRAGQAYDMPHLEMMIQRMRDEAEYKRSMGVAGLNLKGRNQAEIARLSAALMDPAVKPADKQMIMEVIRRLGGGGSSAEQQAIQRVQAGMVDRD